VFAGSKIIRKKLEQKMKINRKKNEQNEKNIEKTQGFLRFLDVVKFDSKTKKPTRTGNKNEKITEKKRENENKSKIH
jgi:hypothetical protein